jgi:hypothetical protein
MRCFFMPKSDWVKRLAMIWALVLGQSMAFGQTLGKSKENSLKPEAVAQLREHYKKNIGADIDLGKFGDEERLEFACKCLMLAKTADLTEEAHRWRREIYLNHTHTVQACFFRNLDGWEGVSAFVEKEYCDITTELDDNKIGTLGQLLVVMSKEHQSPPSYKEALLTYILSEETRSQIATDLKAKALPSNTDKEFKALQIIVANADSPEHQIIDLDDITSSRVVDRYKLYLFERIVSDSKRTNKLTGIAAARAYRRQGQPAKALEAMGRVQGSEKLLELALLKAYNETLKDNPAMALTVLDQFISTNPTEADKKKARDTQNLLRGHFANIGKANMLFQKSAIAVALKKPEAFLVRAFEKDKEDGLEGFLRLDTVEESFELVLLKAKRVIFAVKVSDEGTASYFPNSEVIKKAPTRLWAPKLEILSDDPADFHFKLGTAPNGERTLGEVWAMLLHIVNKYAAQGPDFEGLLKESDFLIGQMTQEGHAVELRSFDGTDEWNSIRLTTDKEMLPSRAEWSNFALEFVTWDIAEAKKTIGALWPKAKEQGTPEINFGEYVSLFGQWMSYLQETTKDKAAEMKPAGEK